MTTNTTNANPESATDAGAGAAPSGRRTVSAQAETNRQPFFHLLSDRIDRLHRCRPGRVYLVQGAPGSGVTMVARRLWQQLGDGVPLRAPHHTASAMAAVGELALSAGGILFLDELLEFPRQVLRSVFWYWQAMHPATRPALVLGLTVVDEVDLSRWPCRSHASQWGRLAGIAEVLPPIDEHILTNPSHSDPPPA